jgi:hypothetical protein
VKSLDQVKAGDEVIVSYTTAPREKGAGDAAPGVSEQNRREGGRKARRNTRPLGDADHHHHCIDLSHDTVTLAGPKGSRTIKVRESADLRKVQVGCRHHPAKQVIAVRAVTPTPVLDQT